MPTKNQPLGDINTKQPEKKWRVVLTWAGEETFLTEEEYVLYRKSIDEGLTHCALKDGRLLTTKPVLVEQNPYWIDPKKAQFIKIKRLLIDEYQELKEQGTFTRFEDYIEWKKKQLTAKKKNE